jgi:hypothetical protein
LGIFVKSGREGGFFTFLRAFLCSFLQFFLGFLGFSWALYDLLSVTRAGAGFAKVCGSLGWLLLTPYRAIGQLLSFDQNFSL